MRIVGWWIVSILFILSCGPTRQDVLQEIQHYEYARTVIPSKFISWLNDEDKVVRRAAVETLGRIQDTSAISWVVNRLHDPDDPVRSAAAFAIGQLSSPAAEEALRSILVYEKNTEIQGRMIGSLGKVGTESSFIFMRNLIEGGTPYQEKAASIGCGIMAYRGYPPHNIAGSLSSLLLATRDPEVAWCAAYGLFRMGTPSEFPALVEAMKRTDPPVRFFSLRAQQVILSYVVSPQSERYRQTPAVLSIATTITSSDYLASLRDMLRDSSWYVRLAALQLLEVFKPAPLFPDIQSALQDSSVHVRSAALQTLASYNRRDGNQVIKKLCLSGKNWRERGQALLVYSQIDPVAALPIIGDLLNQYSWPENTFLIQALDYIDNPVSTQILLRLCETDNPAQLSQVLEALVNRPAIPLSLYLQKLALADPAITTIVAGKLALIKDSTTVTPLLEAYPRFHAPKDLEPILAILSALDSIASPDSREFLERELTHPLPVVRATAGRALAKITPESISPDKTENLPVTRFDFPQKFPNRRPKIRFTTTRGDFEIVLFPEKAPVTVANFLELVGRDFYSGIYFHRVVPGFVIQAGDPRGDGWGGPGYSIPCEYNDIFYERGTVGMAHAGKDTGGSQFFITHTPQPHLNGRHTAFGAVVSGGEVIDQIQVYDQIIKTEILN